jgi:deoxyribonuclease V
MPKPFDESWLYPPSLEAAVEIQKMLADRIILKDDFDEINLLGGMDVSNNPYDKKQLVYGTLVTLKRDTLQHQEVANHCLQEKFPYITGFLGFREAPVLLQAWQKLTHKPDLIFVDGHGISHPRGLGVASHIGVLLDRPTIGVAKSILVGRAAGVLGPTPGQRVPLIWKGKEIGILLRTRLRANPLIISPGHKISMETAVNFVVDSLKGYRLPEATRQAHLYANIFRKAHMNSCLDLHNS